MTAAALNARNAAAAALKETIRDIQRYKTKPNPNKRLLQVKHQELQAAKDELFAKHCQYAELSKKNLELEELVQWITPHMDDASDLLDEIYLDIDALENLSAAQQKTVDDAAYKASKDNEMRVAELQSDAEEHSLNDRITLMIDIVEDEERSTKDDSDLVHTYLDQAKENLEDFLKSCDLLKPLLTDEEKLKELFAKQEAVKKHVADNAAQATFFINKVNPDVKVPSKSYSASSTSMDLTSADIIKTEKVKNPLFNGDIRTFARFKADFIDFAVPKYPSKKNQAYMLTALFQRFCIEAGREHG